jgi:hypothetical protein
VDGNGPVFLPNLGHSRRYKTVPRRRAGLSLALRIPDNRKREGRRV